MAHERLKWTIRLKGKRGHKGAREAMIGYGKQVMSGGLGQEPVKDPAQLEWHEACLPKHRRKQKTKVAHYYLPACAVLYTADRSVNTMTGPMQVREDNA